ncbi:MAG TPA: SDR family oxidoreductase [Steroidobacteraceae bacterium]|nr:SDR family oxidoreductase [Steroidobacteraceae bacterium]
MTGLFDIAGKVALVTGGAQGMGRMIAEGLVEAGAKVYITSRKYDVCRQTACDLAASGGECVALSADLATPEAAVALANEIRSRETRLHVLVNNAGRTWGAPLESFPDKAWPGVMAVNVQGPFTLVRELLPLLEAAGCAADPARIINIGSLAGAAVERLSAYSYSASKAAIHHLSKVLAADLAERHITVNVIVPGYFPTPMTAHIRKEDAETRKLLARVPLARLGSADDIAGACIFLASRAGSYITGGEIFLDGGMAGCR